MKLTFNQPLNNWNVSNDVTDMKWMFLVLFFCALPLRK